MKLKLQKAYFIVFLTCVFYSSCSAETANSTKDASNQGNNFVFGSYHSTKQKWQGKYHDKLLFPWFTTATKAPNRREYLKLLDTQRKNGVRYLGYYYSATTSYSSESLANHRKFPEVSIPPKEIKYSWVLKDAKKKPIIWPGQKARFYLDVGQREVQDAILTRAIASAKSLGLNVLFLDNWYYKYWSPKNMETSEWTEKCLSFLKRARELTNRNNMKLVVNTSSPPIYWPEFAMHLDGIAYEMGAHPNRLKDRKSYESELSNYEKVIQMGKAIFLYTDRMTYDNKRWDEDGRKAAATAILVLPEKQQSWRGIYVGNPRFEVWPVGGWMMWPEQLGKPIGSRQWKGHTVTRKFQYGSISVTTGVTPNFSITLNY